MPIKNRRYLQDQPHTLAGAGVSLGDTSMTLQSFRTIPDGSGVSIPITMDMFGTKGFGTLEQGKPREEQISFTGVVQNLDGTATLTGIESITFEYPQVSTSGFSKSHAGSVFFVISNNPGLLNSLGNKLNEETIEEKWTFPSVAGDNRPVISADTDAILATELITKGELNRAIQATYLPPTVVNITTGTTGTTQSATLTISHLVPPGLTDSAIFVSIETEENKTISSVTYGGNPLTFVSRETRVTGNLRTEWWRLLSPTAGTANLVITPSANAYMTSHVITMETVNQSTPVEASSTGSNGSGTSVADTITTLTPNALILNAVGTANDPTTFTPTAPLAELAVKSSGASRLLSTSVRSTTTAGAYALAYTISPSTNYANKGIAIRGVSVPGIAGVNSVTGNYIDNTDPANPVSVVPLNNTTNSAPTVNDDESLGYYVDSKWYDTANSTLYTCTDSTIGAAVWVAVNSNATSELSGTIIPIGKYYDVTPSGNRFFNNTFVDVGTNRLYATFTDPNPGNNDSPTILRIFRNQFGSYLQEAEVQVNNTMLTNPVITANTISNTVWTTDDSYLYAIVSYSHNATAPGRMARIDIIRFNLDGTSPTATNIYGVTGSPAINPDLINWQNTAGGVNYSFATINGTSLFLSYAFYNGASYDDQVREYTISGTTYTLANTYTQTGSTGLSNGYNLNYDTTNSQFYICGTNDSDHSRQIETWTISGSNFTYGSSTNYPQLSYGNNITGDIDGNGSGYDIPAVIDKSTYNQVFTVQQIGGNTSGSPSDTVTTSYWLSVYSFPKF